MSVFIVLSQRWHGKLSHDCDLSSVQKVHLNAVPRIGGLAVIGGMVAALLIFSHYFPGLLDESRQGKIALLLLVSVPAFFAGIIEDLTKTVSVKLRLSATLFSALLASYTLGATVQELDIWGVDRLLVLTPVAVVVTALVVAGGANAINIIDGFNGLSSSVLILMAGGLSVVAWQTDCTLVVALGVLCIGATLGFLALNYPCGRLFLGDGGAYLLGFLVAEMAVLLLVRRPEVNAWQVLSICAYPIIEIMFSIYRRKFIRNVSPGAPDALHLHTLVYRRLVFARLQHDRQRPWKRNAAVACVIVPVVAVFVTASALAGARPAAAMLLVALQVSVYLLCYRRLVHGRWLRRAAPAGRRAVESMREPSLPPKILPAGQASAGMASVTALVPKSEASSALKRAEAAALFEPERQMR